MSGTVDGDIGGRFPTVHLSKIKSPVIPMSGLFCSLTLTFNSYCRVDNKWLRCWLQVQTLKLLASDGENVAFHSCCCHVALDRTASTGIDRL